MGVEEGVAVSPPGGPPTLTWSGKRGVDRVDAPGSAQIERHRSLINTQGQAGSGPAGRIYWGDNRAMLAQLLADGWREQVRLIYIDPPYASSANYARKVRLRNRQAQLLTRQVQYEDQWPSDDAYLQFIYERLLLLRDLLAPNGSIWLHSDYRQNHRLRLLLEEVFGPGNYLNTIAWRSQVTRGAKVDAFFFPYSTQYIDVFAKDRRAPTLWHPQRKQLVFTRRQAAAQFMEDEGGFFRTSDPGTYSYAKLKELHAAGRLYAPYDGEIVVDEETQRVYASKGGNIGVKYYLTKLDDGRYAVARGVDNLWDDIPGLGTTPGEDVGYPTQKTIALLRRVIGAATDPGDWVLDAFAGSGTTAVAAQQMGRRWLACDENYGSIQTMRRRLQGETGAVFDLYAMAGQHLQAMTVAESAPRSDLQIQRLGADRATIAVGLRNIATPAVDALLAKAGHNPLADWREAVESVEVDSDYDGRVFCPVLADAPQARRAQVEGLYTVPAPAQATTVAVRVIDVLGNEAIICQHLA